MADLIPKDIATEGQSFKIAWSDGHVQTLPFRQLRLACQCANCVDEWTRQQTLDPATVPEDIKPTQADYVGSYALSVTWSDGHNSGIFTFECLRHLSD